MKLLQSLPPSLTTGRPFTGAWIETRDHATPWGKSASRPFTGAWIETIAFIGVERHLAVAPSRGRGLKQAHQAAICLMPWSPLHGGVD